MKTLKKNISFIEAKSLQSFLASHNISAHLSSEHGLDSLIADNICVTVDEEDFNQSIRLLSALGDDSKIESD